MRNTHKTYRLCASLNKIKKVSLKKKLWNKKEAEFYVETWNVQNLLKIIERKNSGKNGKKLILTTLV